MPTPSGSWREAYQDGQLGRALAAFNRLLERAPEDHEARFQRGLLALALAQPDLAAEDFSRVLAAEPDRERARYRRARALIRLGRHREALADLDFLLPKDPDDYALYVPAPQNRPRGPWRPRASPCRPGEGRSLLPKDPMTLNSQAWMLATGPIDQRDPERAVALARRAVALAPGRQMMLNTLGVALYRAGQYAEAISGPGAEPGRGERRVRRLRPVLPGDGPPPTGTRPRPAIVSTGPCDGGVSTRTCGAQNIPELTGFRAEAEAPSTPCCRHCRQTRLYRNTETCEVRKPLALRPSHISSAHLSRGKHGTRTSSVGAAILRHDGSGRAIRSSGPGSG